MNQQDPVLNELREIKSYLALMTAQLRKDILRAFAAEILKTEGRMKMWDAFDGTRTPDDVGKAAGVTGKAVREAIRDPGVAKFLTIQMVGNAQLASKNMDAVTEWWLSSTKNGS